MYSLNQNSVGIDDWVYSFLLFKDDCNIMWHKKMSPLENQEKLSLKSLLSE